LKPLVGERERRGEEKGEMKTRRGADTEGEGYRTWCQPTRERKPGGVGGSSRGRGGLGYGRGRYARNSLAPEVKNGKKRERNEDKRAAK